MKNVTLLTALCLPITFQRTPMIEGFGLVIAARELARQICEQTDVDPDNELALIAIPRHVNDSPPR